MLGKDLMDSKNSDDRLIEIRQKIFAIDRVILEKLAQRRELSETVAKIKKKSPKNIRDPERESELISSLCEMASPLGLDHFYVKNIYKRIITDSVLVQQDYLQNTKDIQNKKSVSYLGGVGSYSHFAAGSFFSRKKGEIEFIPKVSFKEIMQSVQNFSSDFGVLPIENTTSGGINESYDLLVQSNLKIVGEEILRIDHALMGLPGTNISKIKTIYTHSQASYQCSLFLESINNCQVVFVSSTAKALKKVAESNDPNIAAIGFKSSAEQFALSILEKEISNEKNNYTRFFILSRNEVLVSNKMPSKTTFVFSTPQTAGALSDVLSIFKDNKIPLSKLESRPIPNNPFEQLFYADILGNLNSEVIRESLESARKISGFFKCFGSYPGLDLNDIEYFS